MSNEARDIFANNLRHLINKNNLTQVELAENIDISPSTLSDWVNSKKYPRVDSMQALADYFYVTMSSLMEEHMDEFDIFSIPGIFPIKTKKIPLLGEIACGEPSFADEHFEGYVEVGANIHADFALKAKGDSMVGARILDGDIVFVRNQSTVEQGAIAVVIIDDEATLKRFKQIDDIIILQAANPAYDDIIIRLNEDHGVRILGKAVAFQSDVR